MKFRNKPVVVEAFQYQEQDFCFWPQWASDTGRFFKDYKADKLVGCFIKTPEGTLAVNVGDWIIKGIKGEVYLCKPDIFESTYERVE